MSHGLLHCSVCPKKPNFCDTSHLLTHVSSKGHLSSLHKLQVRSHKELQAATDLAAYNQWYQEHNLGQLLSERLVHKEAKKAGKKVGPTKRNVRQRKVSVYADASDISSPLQLRGNRTTWARAERRRITNAGGTADDYGQAHNSVHVPSSYKTPTRTSISSRDAFVVPDHAVPILDPALVDTVPESLRPKGVQWPGMIMFDAASLDEKRRRNQRKQVSVAVRLEHESKMVVPNEVIYSPENLTMKKARHIDDLEDASSLIDGELPMMVQPQRKRRKPLAKKSANIPRLVKRKPVKSFEPRSRREIADTDELPPLNYIAISSTSPIYQTNTQDSPIKTEDMDCDMPANHKRHAKKQPGFAIYDDNTAQNVGTTHFQRANIAAPYQANPIYGFPTHSRLSFPAIPWLQPQNQQHIYYTNRQVPYYPTYSELQENDVGKENIYAFHQPLMNPHHTINPLTWRTVSPGNHFDMHSPESPFTSMANSFINNSQLEDPFGTIKNPLASALSSESPKARGNPIGGLANDKTPGLQSDPGNDE